MKAVYPVTLHNAALYEPLATLFSKMGPNREHDLYIVTCPAALEAAQIFAKACERLFRSVDIGIVANTVGKTPASRNAMFRDAVYLLEASGNTSAWIWMENAYPIEKDWLQTIQEEWNGKPLDRAYLGCIEKTFFRATDASGKVIREPVPLFQPESTPHMRFGVYPADFAKRSVILQSLGNIPFEIELRNEIAPHCHPSKTIKTMWASKNFERTRTGYSGEQSPEFESEIRKNESTSFGTEGAAVLHGCRDGSMLMVLTGQHWHATERPRKSPNDSRDDSGRVAQLEAQVAMLQAQLSGQVETPPSKGDPLPDGAKGENGDAESVIQGAVPEMERAVQEMSKRSNKAADSLYGQIKATPVKPAPKKRGRPKKLAKA